MLPAGMAPDHSAALHFLQESFKRCAFHSHMSLELEVVGAGEVKVRASHKPEHEQAMGYLHGGVLAVLLDTSTYYAALSHYGPSQKLPLTQEYKINLLSTVEKEDVIATATLLRAGRTVAVAEAKIHTASGKLVAVGLASLLVRG
jgi:uncharacterized protein (TIGR00369 family)